MGAGPNYGGAPVQRATSDWGVTNTNELTYLHTNARSVVNAQYDSNVPMIRASYNLALPSETLAIMPYANPSALANTRPDAFAMPKSTVAPGQIYTPNTSDNADAPLFQNRSPIPRWLMYNGRNQTAPFVLGGLYKTSAGPQTVLNPPSVIEQTMVSQGSVADSQPTGIIMPQWPRATAIFPGYEQSAEDPPVPITNEYIEMQPDGEVLNFQGGQPIDATPMPTLDSAVLDTAYPSAAGDSTFIHGESVGMFPMESQQVMSELHTIQSVPMQCDEVFTNETPSPYCLTLPFGEVPMGQNPNRQDSTYTANDQQGATVAGNFAERYNPSEEYTRTTILARTAYALDRYNMGADMVLADEPDAAGGDDLAEKSLHELGSRPSAAEQTALNYQSNVNSWFGSDAVSSRNQLSEFGMNGYYTDPNAISPFMVQQQETVDASLRSVENRWGLATG